MNQFNEKLVRLAKRYHATAVFYVHDEIRFFLPPESTKRVVEDFRKELDEIYDDELKTAQEVQEIKRVMFKMYPKSNGRWSDNEPNLQNIPVRTETVRKIRDAFVPKEGANIIDRNYSQLELRVLADLIRDEET